MTPAERAALIQRYREGPDVVAAAVAGASEAELDRRPADGSWSARMVVHHLADSEMTSALRVRRLIAEENVAITGYDEELWSRKVYYDRPLELSLAALRAARLSTAEILERMTDGEWVRPGTHNEIGVYTPEVWLGIYARHAHEHAEQIRRAMGRS